METIDQQTLEQLRFPVGPYIVPNIIDQDTLTQWKQTIAELPNRLWAEVAQLTDAQLDTPYRPGGWTVRQVVHHLADSHINSYTRFKLSLTENRPTIKPYLEALWAEMEDGKNLPIEPSMQILRGVHLRWSVVLNQMTPADMAKSFFHPESQEEVRLDEAIGQYDWHCRHHLAHITQLKKRMNW
ncbi:MAG: YfiT family bacillithiol transferase [Bacteroidota bacterium]